MIIVIGLGNPGQKYENTPHNIGFEVIDKFQKEESFPDFHFSKKFQAEVSKKKIEDKEILLVKPQTFMNSSGTTVASLVSFYKIKNLEDLWVIHDDFDLCLGKTKISKNKNSAGHKGVQSIIDSIKNKNFFRFRVGVRHESVTSNSLSGFVLKKFEREIMKKIVEKTKEKLETAIKKGPEKARSGDTL